MTPFQIGWDPDAEDDLARLWLRSSNRKAIAQAVDQAEKLLESDPVKHGRTLAEGLYSVAVPPIVLIYTIEKTTRAVEVCSIGLLR